MKLGPVKIDANRVITSVIATVIAALILRAMLRKDAEE